MPLEFQDQACPLSIALEPRGQLGIRKRTPGVLGKLQGLQGLIDGSVGDARQSIHVIGQFMQRDLIALRFFFDTSQRESDAA